MATQDADTVRWLEARADSFWRDAATLREDGDIPMAVAYETISKELRACADKLDWDRFHEALEEFG